MTQYKNILRTRPCGTVRAVPKHVWHCCEIVSGVCLAVECHVFRPRCVLTQKPVSQSPRSKKRCQPNVGTTLQFSATSTKLGPIPRKEIRPCSCSEIPCGGNGRGDLEAACVAGFDLMPRGMLVMQHLSRSRPETKMLTSECFDASAEFGLHSGGLPRRSCM